MSMLVALAVLSVGGNSETEKAWARILAEYPQALKAWRMSATPIRLHVEVTVADGTRSGEVVLAPPHGKFDLSVTYDTDPKWQQVVGGAGPGYCFRASRTDPRLQLHLYEVDLSGIDWDLEFRARDPHSFRFHENAFAPHNIGIEDVEAVILSPKVSRGKATASGTGDGESITCEFLPKDSNQALERMVVTFRPARAWAIEMALTQYDSTRLKSRKPRKGFERNAFLTTRELNVLGGKVIATRVVDYYAPSWLEEGEMRKLKPMMETAITLVDGPVPTPAEFKPSHYGLSDAAIEPPRPRSWFGMGHLLLLVLAVVAAIGWSALRRRSPC